MPLIFYTMLALVQEFLPHMLEQGDGAILTAQGGSTVQGRPDMSGPSPAQAAQRNYLQALHAEVTGKASTPACSTSVQPSRTVPSTPRWRRPKPRATCWWGRSAPRSATTRAARSSSSPRKTADSTGPDHRGRTWPPGCLIALIALPSRNRSAGVPAAEDALGDGRCADDGEQPQQYR